MKTTVENTRAAGDERQRDTVGPGAARVTVWIAGFIVTVGAGVLTAHGLFGVAVASDVSAAVAWLYPLITDGLALVAYVATTLLVGHGRAYAWCVVVLAAALSGLAQASFLAGGVKVASTVLRFGVGAWPAIAAALAAHLLFLIGSAARRAAQSTSPYSTVPRNEDSVISRGEREDGGSVTGDLTVGNPRVLDSDSGDRLVHGVQGVQQAASSGVQRGTPESADAVSSAGEDDHQVYNFVRPSERGTGVQDDHVRPAEGVQSCTPAPVSDESAGGGQVRWAGLRPALSPRDRAVALAQLHAQRSGELPSVRELVSSAEVSQGTASTVLQELRRAPGGALSAAEQTGKGSQR